MDDPGFWSRLKRARLIRALAVYLGTAWVFLQVVEVLQDGLSLPDWVVPVTLILLGAGFLIVGLTAWVQSHPGMEAREAADEVPGDWELALSEVKDSLFRGEIPHPNWARALVGGVFVFSLLFGAAGLYVVIQDRGESFQPAPIYAGETAPAIAVLPFLVSGSELEEWEEGLADLLSTGLDGAAGLRAVDSRTVLSEWNRVVAEEDPDLATSLSVAEGTGARFALEGSVTSIGSSVRLVARVHDLESGARLGTAQVEGSLDSPHSLVDRLSLDILRILLGGDTEDLPRVDLAAVTTTSTEALKAYLQGERHYREGRFDAAIEAYRDAVRMDSTFALAHHRLSLALGWADTSNPLQERHRERALELADRLPERERLLVTGNLRMTRSPADSTELQTPLEEAVELYPNYAEAWYLLGETYFHEPDLIMPPSEIEEIFERAIELDPRVAAYRIHHVRFSIFLHADSALAARRVAEYREIADSDDLYLPRFEGDRAFAFGDSATRAMVLDTILLLPDPPIVPFVGMTGHPALLDAQEMFLRTGIRELFPSSRIAPDALRTLGRNLANQGRYAEALELLDHPSLAGTAHFACLVGELRMIGVPVGPEAVSRALVGTNDDDSEGAVQQAFCRAWLAGQVGDREAYEAERDRLVAMARDAEGGAAPEASPRSLARLADAYWSWKQEGRLDHAAREIAVTGGPSHGAPYAFQWLGEIRRQAGDHPGAEEAYLSVLGRPSPYRYTIGWYRLADIYAELGDRAKERQALEWVLAAWQNADPVIQPRVEEVRSRLGALE